MSGRNANTSLMVARGVGAEIAFNSSGGAADWIMLVPLGAGGMALTVDGRGPYRVADPAKLAVASLQAHSGRIPIDENHATDLAAPQGQPAPARGWATKLEARSDGIYGHVEWSASGAALMADKAYRFISPVLVHDKAGNVLDLPRASLTNIPNLRGMSALHAQENDNMDMLAQLRKLLGLADDADEAAVIAKVKDACGNSTAMQSVAKAAGLPETSDTATLLTTVTALKAGTSLQSIAKAAGLKDDANEAAIVSAVTALASTGRETITALQSEIKDLGTKLNAALNATARDKATAYVDGEIARGRAGVKPMRDKYIAMHAVNPAEVEELIGAMPIIGPSGAQVTPPPASKDGTVSLNAEQENAAKLLGIDPVAYAKKLGEENAARG